MKKGVQKKLHKAARPVTNEDILRAVVYLTENAVTKEEFVSFKVTVATRKHIEAIKDNIDILGEEIDTVQGQLRTVDDKVAAMQIEMGEMRLEVATKERVQTAKEEIIERFRPTPYWSRQA